MKLRFLGKETTGDQSPTLWETDRDTLVVQGWKVTDAEALAHLSLPANETAVEVPKRLMRYLREAAGRDGDSADQA